MAKLERNGVAKIGRKIQEHNAIFICPQIDVNKEFQRVRDEAEQANQWNDNFEKVKIRLEDKIQELNSEKRNPKERNHCYTRDMFKKEYIDKLRCDLRMIDYLYTRWQAETYDPKFEAFKDALRGDLFDVVKNGPQKLVIFTEAIATANVLQRYIERAKHKSLVITAKNRNEMRKKIKENFDANYKVERKDEYDVLITTDVLAEGINLHRANTILNYDTPWNATRLIQRIGRVNRIGSEHSEVYVYNFYPSDQGNRQINLKQNAFAKLQAFHAQFGGDNKIYSEAEMIPETDYNHWLDEVDGGESPVQTHIRNLKEYKEREPLRYEALCKKARDIVVAYDANCDESYHVVKKSASAAGGFGVRIAGNTAKHIPMLDLLEHIKDAPNLSNLGGVSDVNNVDFNKLIFDEYNRIVHKQIADVNNKDVTAALALIHDWKHKFKLSQETQERLYAIRKLIEGGDNSAIKAILKLSKQLEIGELFPEAKINQTIKEFTQIVHNALLDEEPYLLASVYQVTSAIG